MSLSAIPNVITILRVLLIAPFVWYLQHEMYDNALIIFLIAGFSDGLDGLLAKQFKWQSRFGSITDPLADKLLLFVALLLLAMKGHISWNLFWIATVRDIIIICGATWYHYKVGRYEMRPSLISKWNTALMILLVLLVLINLAWYPLSAWLLNGLEWTIIATCLVSGIHYIWLGRKTYLQQKSGQENGQFSQHS